MNERLDGLLTERDRISAEIGGIENGTLTFLEGRKWVTTNEVARHCQVSPQAANNRLRVLVRHGLAERERLPGEGKRFRYRATRWRRNG